MLQSFWIKKRKKGVQATYSVISTSQAKSAMASVAGSRMTYIYNGPTKNRNNEELLAIQHALTKRRTGKKRPTIPIL